MKLAENRFKRAIKEGRPQIGIWNSLCSEITAEVLSTAGYDWALLDMEHSPSDPRTVLRQMQAYRAGDTMPVVRPPWNEPVMVKRLLDLGAFSLLFPMVQTVEEAEAAVRATRYPPRGIRGVSLVQRGNNFGRVTDYLERIEDEICVLVQIETRAALSRVGEIAQVEGVDGVFYGPADLSADLGIIGKMNDDKVVQAMLDGVKACKAVGKPTGTLMGTPELGLRWFKEGMSFVACATDQGLLARSADANIAAVRKGLGG